MVDVGCEEIREERVKNIEEESSVNLPSLGLFLRHVRHEGLVVFHDVHEICNRQLFIPGDGDLTNRFVLKDGLLLVEYRL